jgi:hypothetical protein
MCVCMAQVQRNDSGVVLDEQSDVGDECVMNNMLHVKSSHRASSTRTMAVDPVDGLFSATQCWRSTDAPYRLQGHSHLYTAASDTSGLARSARRARVARQTVAGLR